MRVQPKVGTLFVETSKRWWTGPSVSACHVQVYIGRVSRILPHLVEYEVAKMLDETGKPPEKFASVITYKTRKLH